MRRKQRSTKSRKQPAPDPLRAVAVARQLRSQEAVLHPCPDEGDQPHGHGRQQRPGGGDNQCHPWVCDDGPELARVADQPVWPGHHHDLTPFGLDADHGREERVGSHGPQDQRAAGREQGPTPTWTGQPIVAGHVKRSSTAAITYRSSASQTALRLARGTSQRWAASCTPTARPAGQRAADRAGSHQIETKDQVAQMGPGRQPGRVARTCQEQDRADSQGHRILEHPQPDSGQVGSSPHRCWDVHGAFHPACRPQIMTALASRSRPSSTGLEEAAPSPGPASGNRPPWLPYRMNPTVPRFGRCTT